MLALPEPMASAAAASLATLLAALLALLGAGVDARAGLGNRDDSEALMASLLATTCV